MTSISAPTFVAEGVLHYGVANMPALVARTATLALAQAALPCVHRLAEQGVAAALRIDAGLRAGLQVWDGAIVHPALAADVGLFAAPVAIILARANELQYKTALQGIWETSCGYSDSPAGPAAARRR